MKKMKSFMEGIGKNFVIKGFYRNFLTLKGKFHHQSQIKTIRKEGKNKKQDEILTIRKLIEKYIKI